MNEHDIVCACALVLLFLVAISANGTLDGLLLLV